MTPTKKRASTDGGASEVTAKLEEEQEQGFHGKKVDPTPNENYSVAGVTANKPTPETDDELSAEAKKSSGTS